MKFIAYFILSFLPALVAAQSPPALYVSCNDRCCGADLSKYLASQAKGENVVALIEEEIRYLREECGGNGKVVTGDPPPPPIKDENVPPPPPPSAEEVVRDDSYKTETPIIENPLFEPGCPDRSVWMEIENGRWNFYYCKREQTPIGCNCIGEKQRIWSVNDPGDAPVDPQKYVVNVIPVLINKNDKQAKNGFIPFDIGSFFFDWMKGRIPYPSGKSLNSLNNSLCELHEGVRDSQICPINAEIYEGLNRDYEFRFIVPGQKYVWLINSNGRPKTISAWDIRTFFKSGENNKDRATTNFLYNLAVIAVKDPNMALRFPPSSTNLRAFVTGSYKNKSYAIGIQGSGNFFIPIRIQLNAEASHRITKAFVRSYSGSYLETIAKEWQKTGKGQYIYDYMPSNTGGDTSPIDSWGNPRAGAKHPKGWRNVSDVRNLDFLIKDQSESSYYVIKNGKRTKVDPSEGKVLEEFNEPWLNWLIISDPEAIFLDVYSSGSFVVISSKPTDLFCFSLKSDKTVSYCFSGLPELSKNVRPSYVKNMRVNRNLYTKAIKKRIQELFEINASK